MKRKTVVSSIILCLLIIASSISVFANSEVQFTQAKSRYNVYVAGTAESVNGYVTITITENNEIKYINQYKAKSDGSYEFKFPYDGDPDKMTLKLKDSTTAEDITDTITKAEATSNMLSIDVDIKNSDSGKVNLEAGDKAKISAKITNKYLDNTEYNLILASYDANESLICTKLYKFMSGYDLTSDISKTINDYEVPQNAERTKVFVWSVSDMTPLGNVSKILSKPVTVHLLGDSLCANYENLREVNYPMTGWGQLIGDYFANGVVIDNQARRGWSSKAFLLANAQTTTYDPDKLNNPDKSLWSQILPTINQGDYVIISFAINDAMQHGFDFYYEDANGNYVKNADGTYTQVEPGKGKYSFYTWTCSVDEYGECLQKLIDDTVEKGATPILYSPTPICAESLHEATKDYADKMIEIAEQNDICYLDGYYTYEKYVSEKGGYNTVANLNHFTRENLIKFREEGMKLGREWDSKPGGDSTHYNPTGAKYVTEMIVDLISKSDSSLKKYIK